MYAQLLIDIVTVRKFIVLGALTLARLGHGLLQCNVAGLSFYRL